MRCYIAAPWVNKSEALAAKQLFEAAGLEITSHWITRDSSELAEPLFGNPANEDYLCNEAVEDVEDIVQSDVFVILNLAKSEGKATELGFAYALGLPVILVGQRDTNIFYFLPSIFRADTVEDAIKGILEAMEKEKERELAATPTGLIS